MSLIRRARRLREMTLLARTRRRLQQLGPYQSLLLLLIPLALVEPLKLVSLVVAGKGHWLSGSGMIVAAYAGSILVVERLFRIVKPKLITLGWFAWLWGKLDAARKLMPWSASPDETRKPDNGVGASQS
jgi:hypothetical protein